MTRVLVVDDSGFMRTVIGNALTDAGYEVETATDGSEAIEAAAASDPDVITMDVEMPELDGIEAVERIMATNPTSILMLSVHTERGAEATLDALERGAVDFLHKPDGPESGSVATLTDEVVAKVDELANADVSSLALARAAASAYSTAQATAGAGTGTETRIGAGIETGPATAPDADELSSVDLEGEYADDPTLVLGASTGGPKIVEGLFERLPGELGAKVLVVQHMPATFTGRFADRLDARSAYDVREAGDGDAIRPGEAAVAPGDSHLEVASNVAGRLRVRLDDGDRVHGVRPAIDVTMQTAAERVTDPLCGVVLSGMGRDGAAGIEAIDAAGGHTIAQDEATSPVFGIPCQAIRTGCVDDVAPANRLVETIVDAFEADGDTDD